MRLCRERIPTVMHEEPKINRALHLRISTLHRYCKAKVVFGQSKTVKLQNRA